MRRRTLLALAFTLSACADATGPAPGAAGTWVGESQGISARFVLDEAGSTVSGTGPVFAAGVSASVTVSGTRTWRVLSLTLSSPGFPSATFIGVVSPNRIEGTLNAGTPVRIALQRE